MKIRVRPFAVYLEYKDSTGHPQEETFPVRASDHASASRMAFDYVLKVLRYQDFELRVVGA